MESIQLKNDNLFKIGIKNNEGQDTGEVITIDMEDIELPLKLQECETKIKQNEMWLGIKKKKIKSRTDKKDKKLLRANKEYLIK